ncbi:MAG: cobalamin-dependent protein [Deltaproteobacteria bacterium]|nr:cobalamin-dependent protein [Deltaproteobacteria bacterium]
MRVLLINPPYTTEDRYGKDLGKFGPLNEPLGLAYLAANLERGGHEVAILDAPALNLTSSDICQYMEGRPYDLIGVTMLTPMYNRSVEVVRALRHAFPGITIVVGGPHPTILPRETLLDNKEIDFVVIGEGEVVFLDLVNALDRAASTDDIPGIGYRKNGTVIINQPPAMISNLDDLPIPARHLLPMNAYHMTKSRTKSEHAFTVSVARGCPFNCAFCCRIFGRKVRHHSVERIVQEISILVDEFRAKEINLEADTLTLNKHFVRSLCDELVRSGLSKKIAWTCESRIDTVNEEILRKMRAAGCWQVSYGVETGSQRLLDLIHKDTTLEQVEETFKITKRVGISIRAFFMLGIPTETRQESLKTISFAKKLDARWSQFTVCTPFPGTELYDLALRDGGLQSQQWADYKTHGGWTDGSLAYVPKGRSVEEMKRFQKRAYRAVYLRPRVFIRFLRDIDSMKKVEEYAAGLLVLIKTAFPSRPNIPKVIKADRDDLERFARGVYVDSPVYFNANPLVRFLNWKKLDAVVSLLVSHRRGRILDFGCGNGVMLPTLAGIFDTVVGVDLYPAAASRMKQEYGLHNAMLVKADGTKLPLKDGSFDAVLATSVLEHFRDIEKAIAEIARVTKKGGCLLFLSPTENRFYRLGRWLFRYKKPEDHYHAAKEIEAILETFFVVEARRDFPFNLFSFLSIYRLGRFRLQPHTGGE